MATEPTDSTQPAEPAVTLQQFRELVEMLRHTIAGASDLARRIEVLEKAAQETFTVLVSLQSNQHRLLDTIQSQSEAQNALNAHVARTIEQLLLRIEPLEGPQQVM